MGVLVELPAEGGEFVGDGRETVANVEPELGRSGSGLDEVRPHLQGQSPYLGRSYSAVIRIQLRA